MTYYHATTRDRIESIQRRGLVIDAPKNWDCEKGVYLAEHPGLAVGILLEMFLSGRCHDKSPMEVAESFCVIVIDGGRVNEAMLRPDPAVPRPGFWIYPRTIDVTAMPIIDALDALASDSLTPLQKERDFGG